MWALCCSGAKCSGAKCSGVGWTRRQATSSEIKSRVESRVESSRVELRPRGRREVTCGGPRPKWASGGTRRSMTTSRVPNQADVADGSGRSGPRVRARAMRSSPAAVADSRPRVQNGRALARGCRTGWRAPSHASCRVPGGLARLRAWNSHQPPPVGYASAASALLERSITALP